MSDAELHRLIEEMEVDEEWPTANGTTPPDDLLERRRSSGGHEGHGR